MLEKLANLKIILVAGWGGKP